MWMLVGAHIEVIPYPNPDTDTGHLPGRLLGNMWPYSQQAWLYELLS